MIINEFFEEKKGQGSPSDDFSRIKKIFFEREDNQTSVQKDAKRQNIVSEDSLKYIFLEYLNYLQYRDARIIIKISLNS